jgi:hypothetical protein
LLAPADEQSILGWIGLMGALVAKKDQGGEVSDLEVIAYAQKLSEWPGDVVREVLIRYPDTHKWWPEWATLRALLAEASAERMAIAASYRRWIEAPEFMARREGIAPPEPRQRTISAPPGEQKQERPADPAMTEWTPEEIDRRRKQMRAAILRGE